MFPVFVPNRFTEINVGSLLGQGPTWTDLLVKIGDTLQMSTFG